MGIPIIHPVSARRCDKIGGEGRRGSVSEGALPESTAAAQWSTGVATTNKGIVGADLGGMNQVSILPDTELSDPLMDFRSKFWYGPDGALLAGR